MSDIVSSTETDLITCPKEMLRQLMIGMSPIEKRRVYRARWAARNPGKTEEAIKQWVNDNPDKRKKYRKEYAEDRRQSGLIPYHTEWNRSNRAKAMLSSARFRAKKKGLDFNITLDDIIIPIDCPVFGFTLETRGSVGRSDASPSLDRINNSLGYIKGNVLVVSWLANRLKNDATPDQLRIVANFYEAQAA